MAHPHDDFPTDDAPLFNIGAVTRMTGIAETTLRMWERRYGFPVSQRTSGGHRLYSQHEVARLRWVKQRVDEGLQISQAIQALEHVEREGVTPLWAPTFTPPEPGGPSAEMFCQQLTEALFQHDIDRADQVLAEAYPLLPVENLVLDVIGPALRRIGDAWAEGRIGVATEHFSSHYLRTRLLMWLRAGPPVYRVSPVALACAPGELHEGSLLMLGVLMRRLRWPIVYLGQTMPLSELPAFVEAVDPAVIVFVAMREEPAQALAEWPRWLPQAASAKHPIVAYGGRAFTEQPALAEQVPGVLLGSTLREGIDTLNRMLHELNPFLP